MPSIEFKPGQRITTRTTAGIVAGSVIAVRPLVTLVLYTIRLDAPLDIGRPDPTREISRAGFELTLIDDDKEPTA